MPVTDPISSKVDIDSVKPKTYLLKPSPMPVKTKQLKEPDTMSPIVDKISVQTKKSLPKSSLKPTLSPSKGPVPRHPNDDIDPVQKEANLLNPPPNLASNQLKIYYNNADCLTNKLDELEATLKNQNIDVAVITETFAKNTNSPQKKRITFS